MSPNSMAMILNLARLKPEVRGRASSLALLGCVRDALGERCETSEQDVAFILLGLPEFGVSAVEPVQNAKDPVTLVEPEHVCKDT